MLNDPIIYFSLARYAFIEALKIAGVGMGSRVLLPSYICRDLLASLHVLGAIPCWYEVSTDLSPATESTLWPLADVVLLVNYFGFPQNLQPFLKYSTRTGAKIVEDNAHGYLSRDGEGCLLGCRVEMGLFSFRKTLRIPDGAALWIDPRIASQITLNQKVFDGAGVSRAQLVKAFLRRLPMVGEFLYRTAIVTARLFRKYKTGNAFPTADSASEKQLPVLPNPWSGLLRALTSINGLIEVRRRRNSYRQCLEIATLVSGIDPVFPALPLNCSPYGFAFRGDINAQYKMSRYALKHGFDLVSWPDLPDEILPHAPEHYKNIFLVNFLW